MNIDHIMKMAHNPVGNYIIPGLTSWIVGAESKDKECGMVRLFVMERHQYQQITPHSHRFDLHCVVLKGSVRNRMWRYAPSTEDWHDVFVTKRIGYNGEPGRYIMNNASTRERMRSEERTYYAGDEYFMKADEIHDIWFEKGAMVLVFEGPKVADHSNILLPFNNGTCEPANFVEDWMFNESGSFKRDGIKTGPIACAPIPCPPSAPAIAIPQSHKPTIKGI